MEAKINIDRIGDDLVAAFNDGYQQGLADAKVERETGKWLEKDIVRNSKHPIDMLQSARCSVCNRYHITPFSYHFYDYKYCPKCGASMVTDDA